VCVIYAAVSLCFRKSFPSYFGTVQAKLFGILYVIVLLQGCLNPGLAAGNVFMHWTSFLLLFFANHSLITSINRLRWVLLAAVNAVTLASLYVLRQWQTYHSVYASFRPGGATGDSNYFALAAVCFLPLALFFLVRRRNIYEKAVYLLCCVTATVAMTFSSSRGGFLALLAALIFMVLRFPNRLRNLGLVTLVILPLSLAPGSPVQRFLQPSYGDEIGTAARLSCWKAALLMMRDYPLTGTGLGSFIETVTSYQAPGESFRRLAHNTYLELGAELGIPALLIFIALLCATFMSLEQTRRCAARSSSFIADAAVGLQAGVVACAVAIAFLTAAHQKFVWLLVFLSMSIRELALSTPKTSRSRRRPKATSPASPPDGGEEHALCLRTD
jgi:O-antigen ligase